MSTPYYLEAGGHAVIAGATGARDDYGGKSVLANWWQDRALAAGLVDAAAFLNPKGHRFVRGEPVESLAELAEAWSGGTRQFDVRMSRPDRLIETLIRLPGEKHVVFDEAWEYAGSDQLAAALRKYGNLDESSWTCHVVSQRAWDLPDAILGNCPLKIWVGPLTSEGRAYFQSARMDQVPEAIDAEGGLQGHEWAVVDGGELQAINGAVPAEYADG